ncbi:uncharacterized protein LOC125546554 [Triticum urartu]|uniref:uncharacterized protein LOC125546554 n=1 Tax=Triticum urartu TaxID=4572 RepID=UPI0020436D43|nr:uncharacterized protein LOC125546554 [Triticum urartu]
MGISYEERNLRVVDVYKEEHFNISNSSCQFPTWNTSAQLAPPFKVNPANLNLVFYNFTETAAHRNRALVKMRCVDAANAYVRTRVRYDATRDYAGYALEGCNAIVVPVMASSSSTNTSHYKQLIRAGFHMSWDLPPLPAPVPPPTPAPARKFTRRIIFKILIKFCCQARTFSTCYVVLSPSGITCHKQQVASITKIDSGMKSEFLSSA